ncbi:MAG: hypothetical protein OEU36_18390 [Gammaproteobacteria bacterium]|nr:hypothetical protein [Gammaproteobacteria bacterium]
MKKPIAAILANVLILISAQVYAAKPWNLKHEEVASFEAKVVDVLCELSGDCADNCGGGKRVLGLLKADGTLHLAVKGGNNFAGAVSDLIPHCGKSIEVDGLLIKNPLATIFFVQGVRTGPDVEWMDAKKFKEDWLVANPGGKDPWFRNDPVVKEIIEQDGVFGLPGVEPPAQ